MDIDEHILQLVLESHSDIENSNVPLSTVISKCIRVAKLRNDFYNLIWLEWEMIDLTDKDLKYSVLADLLPHFNSETLVTLDKKFVKQWAGERKFKGIEIEPRMEIVERYSLKGVGEIEAEVEYFERSANDIETPAGLHSLDLYFVSKDNANAKFIFQHNASECKKILERIRYRVFEFLSSVEKELLFGQIYADIFEQNRHYVDARLKKISPEVLEKFVSAYKRMKDNDVESWAQALTSCRRLLKSIADALYPPRNDFSPGFDGQRRKLTDENYISRLWQFTFEKLSTTRSGELLQTQIEKIGNRLDRLYALTNKGVHADVSRFEVNQAIIQTYLIVGDILRIADDITAIKYQEESATG